MSGESEDRTEQSQSEATQKATAGGVRQTAERPGGLKGLTEPFRGGLARIRERYDRLPALARYAVTGAVIAFAAVLPGLLHYFVASPAYWASILVKIGIAALLALGLNVVVGFAGLLDLGYVAFFAVGAYSFAILSGASRYSVAIQNLDPNAAALKPEWHMYMWLFFFAAIAISLLAGVVLGFPTLRLRGDYLAIVTLGFGEIVRVTFNNLHSLEGGPRGTFSIPHPAVPGRDFGLQNDPYYWLLLGIIVTWIFLLRRLNDSRIGRAWVAIREDELAAAAMGVPTIRMKLLAFAIGAAVASLGGVVYASQVNAITPQTFTLFNISFGSVVILAMVVLGGMGGIAGPILGAAMIIFLPERFRTVGDARLMLFGAALVAIMILRPQGLFPGRRRAQELRGGEVRDASLFEVQEHAK